MGPEFDPATLQAYLERHDLSARALAAHLGASASTVGRWLLPRDDPRSRRPSGLYAHALRRMLRAEGRAGDGALVELLLGGTAPPATRTAASLGYHAGVYRTARGLILNAVQGARELIADAEGPLGATN